MHMPMARVRQIYITHQSKEIGDEKMTRQQRKKQLKSRPLNAFTARKR